MKKLTPFDYVTAINEKKAIESMAGFNPYLCNHSLSNHLDTCLIANEMNTHPNLPPLAQYDFLYGAVRKGKRWGKWFKGEDPPHLELIMNHFKYNKQKALEALSVLTQKDIKAIIELQDKGGNK